MECDEIKGDFVLILLYKIPGGTLGKHWVKESRNSSLARKGGSHSLSTRRTFARSIDMNTGHFASFFLNEWSGVVVPVLLENRIRHHDSYIRGEHWRLERTELTSVKVYGPSLGSRMDATDEVRTKR